MWKMPTEAVTATMKTPGSVWYQPPSLCDVFRCVYSLGAHDNYDTLWLFAFYNRFCMAVRTGLKLTLPEPPPSPIKNSVLGHFQLIRHLSNDLILPAITGRICKRLGYWFKLVAVGHIVLKLHSFDLQIEYLSFLVFAKYLYT